MVTGWLSEIPRLLDRYDLKGVYAELDAGLWQLWLMIDEEIEGVLITNIVHYPLSKELHLLGVAGRRMPEWKGLIKTIELYAHQNDCEIVMMVGARPGFSRVFPEYTGNRLVLEKRL